MSKHVLSVEAQFRNLDNIAILFVPSVKEVKNISYSGYNLTSES